MRPLDCIEHVFRKTASSSQLPTSDCMCNATSTLVNHQAFATQGPRLLWLLVGVTVLTLLGCLSMQEQHAQGNKLKYMLHYTVTSLPGSVST